MFAMAIFMIGTMLACIASGRWLLDGEVNIFNSLASFNTMTVQAGGVWGVPKQVTSFFAGIITALGWNYPFLSSPWAIILKIPLWLISIGVVWGLVQVALTAVNGLVSAVRSFISPTG